MSRREAAQVLAMCAWVKRHISKIEDRAKTVADVTFPDEKTAAVVNDTVVAYTSRVSRKPELKILDEGLFTAWVASRWPGEIIQSVNPAFVQNHLYQNAVEHDGVIVDDMGEVCEYAELSDPVEYTTTRLTKNADVLEPILSAVSLADLPALIEAEPVDRWSQDVEAGAIGGRP